MEFELLHPEARLQPLRPESGQPLQLTHWGDIPVDSAVREAVMRRQLLLQSMPGAPASLAVAQLSNKIKAALTAPA